MSLIRKLLNTECWCHPNLIPQQKGFKFRARLKDGRDVHCETFVKEMAIRVSVRSAEVPDLKFSDIESWLGF